MKYIFLILSIICPKGFTALENNPVMNIYTDNVENTFYEEGRAQFFVEILTDFEYPNGKAEFVLDARILGTPDIPLEMMEIGKRFYSFTSNRLTIEQVGRRYFSVDLKVRSKKDANRIRKAVKSNDKEIEINVAARDNADDDFSRDYHQRQIDYLYQLNADLKQQLEGLLTSLGEFGELGFQILPRRGYQGKVLLSEEFIQLAEGESAEYSIKLNSRPVSDVVVEVFVESDDVVLGAQDSSQVELLFTPENYDRAQGVIIQAEGNDQVGDPRTIKIHHQSFSKDDRFNELPVKDAIINILDTTEGAGSDELY